MIRYQVNQGVKKLKSTYEKIAVRVAIAVTASVAALAFSLAPAGASGTAIYNNIPSPQPGNVPSVAFEATGTSEFGGQVSFAGTTRNDPAVTVLMSSWGCQTGHWTTGDCATTPGATFSEPITLNIYNVNGDNSPGSLVKSVTQTFNIPYRPSASPSCTGADAGKWFDGTTCFNGFAAPISFNLTGTTLPNKAIVSVAYNTSDYGYSPIGRATACSATPAGCGYDSLNVGTAGAPTTGTQPVPNDAYQDTLYDSCSNGAISPFGIDSGCWGGFQPAIKVETAAAQPTDKDQCKKDGWKDYGIFKNQGDCVSFVATNGKNQPSGH